MKNWNLHNLLIRTGTYKHHIKILLLISIAYTSIACVQQSDTKSLENALELAGSNRVELEKVLDHYSKEKCDSLKLKAAKFLINNMDVHFSCKSKTWDEFQIELDTLFSHETQLEELELGLEHLNNKYASRINNDIEYISDLHTVSANFLIYNIEMAFESWKSPFAQHLSFDDFCEYILPYRAGNEPLSDWREEFQKNYIPAVYTRLDKKQDYTPIDLCNAIKSYPYSFLSPLVGSFPDYNAHLLSVMRIANCRQYCLQVIMAARCLGVPICHDYTPQWATRSMGHEWNALIQTGEKPLSFGIGDNCNLGEHIEFIPDRIPPKIYRKTFAKQRESLAMLRGNEEIPPTLASPCMKDVTIDYYSCIDVPVKFDFKAPEKNKFAYLAVFDNKNWIPVCWASVKKGKSTFKNINKNILYLPGYYNDQKFIPAADPFIIDSLGNIRYIKLNLEKKQTMVLSRKYQIGLVDEYCKEMVGGKFQVSDNPYFNNAIDLYEIREKPEASYQIVSLKYDHDYKYFRYIAPLASLGTISELEVFESVSNKKLSGKIIGTEQTYPGITKEKAFDGDPLTSFIKYGATDNVWIGLEFDSPKKIEKIVFLPKNDDNCIRDGELYELFYWDNEWMSLGKQYGSSETYKLKYENVPANALYLLRNLTKGKEERIFTYENNRQVWW